jgi:hypothetical protein
MVLTLLMGCGQSTGAGAVPIASETHLPEHSECVPEGQEMSVEICLAVVEADGRQPSQSFYKVSTPPPDPDPRMEDPEYGWLTSEASRCTCICCHSTSTGGPGVFHWDLDFEPMWIDSASDWTLLVFSGMEYSAHQALPTDDVPRLQALIQAELDRRDAAKEASR